MGKFILFILLFSLSLRAESAELKHGRYTGWIELEEKKERLAVVAEFFLESPEDFTKFPRLNAAFRVSLGGYNTHEYFTETFHDLKFDFDFGNLTFDESGNDLLMTTLVSSKGGSTYITGEVFLRSSAARGSLFLTQESDEPGDDAPLAIESPLPFMPLLEGQYEGLCDGQRATLQIQTVRGLDATARGAGLERHYGIAARLAYKQDPLCGNLPSGQWCSRQFLRNGTFNLYTGRLNFESQQGSESCTLTDGEIHCRFRSMNSTADCFLKKSGPATQAKFYPRKFHLSPSKDQSEALPPQSPPRNQALADALRGRFFGYAHNESDDSYLPLRLDVVPFSSTENPHNPNQMMVSATASVFLGGFSGPFFTQRFEPRSFYLRPGFALSGTDSLLLITSWKRGYISGTWISKAYGKLGTFELSKGDIPPLAPSAKLVRSFAGEFSRLNGSSEQWIRFLFPSQPDNLQDLRIPFVGSYQSVVGSAPVRAIESGSFDPFTGRFGWRIKRDEAITYGGGIVAQDGSAHLYWPPEPNFGTVARDLEFQVFQPKNGGAR